MVLSVTRLQATATPGRRMPGNPQILTAVFRLFAERVADKVFVDPVRAAKSREFSIVTQFAQVVDDGVTLIIQMIKQSDGTPLDISAATELKVIIGLPNGVKYTRSAALLTDGLDGKLYYVSNEDDVPIPGYYSIQGKAIIPSGTFYSEVQTFQVLENVEATGNAPEPDPHTGNFTNSDLAGGVLLIYHYEGLEAPFPVTVTIFDQDGKEVQPDSIEGHENYVAIDLTSFAPISGTWGYVYQ